MTGAAVRGDFADGLQGGPGFWQVTAGGGLTPREVPSTGAPVLTTLSNGRQPRNLGCRMAEAQRWWNVATLADPGFEGPAAAEFPVEGRGDGATERPEAATALQAAGDARVAGTEFNATGPVECSPAPAAKAQMCDFGVIRDGNGTGTVIATLRDGTSRAIFHGGGLLVNFDRSEADGDLGVQAEKPTDGQAVFIGQTRFRHSRGCHLRRPMQTCSNPGSKRTGQRP